MSNRDNSTDIAIQEFLARGGVIQKIEPNVSGRVEGVSYSAWGRPKKPAATPAAEEIVLDEIQEEDLDVEGIVVVESEDIDEE